MTIIINLYFLIARSNVLSLHKVNEFYKEMENIG